MKPLDGVLRCLLRDGAEQPISNAGFQSVQISNEKTKFEVLPLPFSVLNAELQSVGLVGAMEKAGLSNAMSAFQPRTDAVSAFGQGGVKRLQLAFHKGSI